ncbi:MAG TPA: 2OG-Fe(II) oxygenase [Candidatus Sulfotelmatobacter sp.]
MQDERILSGPERSLLATLLQHAKAAAGENQETQNAVRTVIASALGETVAQRAFAVLGGSIVENILSNSGLPLGDLSNPRTESSAGPHLGPHSPFEQDPSGEFRRAMSESHVPLRSQSQPQSPGSPQPPGVKAPDKGPQPSVGPMRTPVVPGAGQPQSPGGPQPPGVHAPHKEPHAPGQPMRTPGVPASPGQPQSPGGSTDLEIVAQKSVAVLERPSRLPARCVLLDEFLAPQELEELTGYTLAQEVAFSASEVISPAADGGVVNYEHRRSRVLMDLAQYQNVMLERIKTVLPQVLQKLGMEEFSIAGVEAQITASNDGDFFRFHSDNGSDRVAARHLTFVYFFQREPRRFEGGELLIYDARLEGDNYASEGSYQTIIPQQNQIVFFPCELLHEITPVKCPSGQFADSRFTLNGWLRH